MQTTAQDKEIILMDDFSSFFDSDFSISIPPPLTTNNYNFAGHDDSLESPLGLQDFDYFYSPALSDSLESLSGLGTPELGDFTSLFSEEFIEEPIWNANNFILPPLPEQNLPIIPEVEVEKEVVIKLEELIVGEEMEKVEKKVGKFNGTRNTKIKAIPMDSPTLSRNYVIPSSTSRKRSLPTSTTSNSTKKVKISSDQTNELSEDVLSAIEIKRRSNTLAARKSRNRKSEHLEGLMKEIESLKNDRDEWKLKAEELEELVRALRGC